METWRLQTIEGRLCLPTDITGGTGSYVEGFGPGIDVYLGVIG